MKDLLKIISIVYILLFTFPTLTFAEEKQNFPVIVEADCTVVDNNTKGILIKELKITESTPNAFLKGDKFTFNVKGMDFEQVGMIENSTGTTKNKVSFSQEGDLVITINDANDFKVETITLSNIELTAKWTLPVGTYYLYMKSSDLGDAKVPVVTDFVKVINNIDFYEKKELEIEVKMGSNTIMVNNTKKYLRVPAYISGAGYTMLPIREITEVFPGTKVVWDNDRKEAEILHGYDYVSIIAGADIMHLNGEENALKNASEVHDGRMFVSLRDMCRICNIPSEDIQWDNNTKIVTIITEVYE